MKITNVPTMGIRRRADPSINDQQDAATGALSLTVPRRLQRDFSQPTDRATEPIRIHQPPTNDSGGRRSMTNHPEGEPDPTDPNQRQESVSRGLRAITVRLDQPNSERINRRIPSDYRTLSALVRAASPRSLITGFRLPEDRPMTVDRSRLSRLIASANGVQLVSLSSTDSGQTRRDQVRKLTEDAVEAPSDKRPFS